MYMDTASCVLQVLSLISSPILDSCQVLAKCKGDMLLVGVARREQHKGWRVRKHEANRLPTVTDEERPSGNSQTGLTILGGESQPAWFPVELKRIWDRRWVKGSLAIWPDLRPLACCTSCSHLWSVASNVNAEARLQISAQTNDIMYFIVDVTWRVPKIIWITHNAPKQTSIIPFHCILHWSVIQNLMVADWRQRWLDVINV